MITADQFLLPAKEAGFDFFTGVPCSFLTPLINRVIGGADFAYVPAASEGEAVAIAAGAWLAGRKTVMMMQNSGLGNAVNPLTSLNYPFKIPTLIIVTWRGGPGLKDEPQHELMGEITPALLDTMKIPHKPFPKTEADVASTLAEANAYMDETGLPFALIMEKGDVETSRLDAKPAAAPADGELEDLCGGGDLPTRMDALKVLTDSVTDKMGLIATTGKCGRELFTIEDKPSQLYQVGSMGCSAAMTLGTALNTPKTVIAVDGDGACLMKMGTLATIGAAAPENLIHLVLDNRTYDSTGGQPTVSGMVDFANAALACGYAKAYRCDSLKGFRQAVIQATGEMGPICIHMRILPGSMKELGRPTVKPHEVARRFKDFITH